jgi:hypothetical protein
MFRQFYKGLMAVSDQFLVDQIVVKFFNSSLTVQQNTYVSIPISSVQILHCVCLVGTIG